MESFLYAAENRLREYRTKNPLLIFRNDGDASRVAKTIAAKTYSSGPRGGMEGVKTFCKRYNLGNVVSMDVGGTTTDIGQVIGNAVYQKRHGAVEGIPISFALCEIASPGVGGSSILSVKSGVIEVGPESVGAVPGPACFGRGGKNATITDVYLLRGLLDPATYFGGGLSLDIERARTAITENIADPLGISVEEALIRLHDAFEEKIAKELLRFTDINEETVLMAFGGAGPMNACGVAEKAGISTVYVPKTAAVFSAFGIGACDIGQSYTKVLSKHAPDALAVAYELLLERAERDMFAEGVGNAEYEVSACLVAENGDEEAIHQLNGNLVISPELAGADTITLEVSARKRLRTEDERVARVERIRTANSSGTRTIFGADQGWKEIPVYEVNAMKPGDFGAGPAVVEEEFFTCQIPDGWEFVFTELGDICLTKGDK
jgi:N-methylhydantoinase A/oxoprolinase/acetone carboxylase beta subunit